MRLLVVSVLVFTLPTIASASNLKIAVMPAKYAKSATKAVEHEVFDEAVLAAVQSAGAFDVIGKSDMDAVLGFDKQKQELGCTDTACFAEIGGALGVDRIVDVQLARTDALWVVSAKLIDIKAPTPQVVSRISDSSARGGAAELLSALPTIIARLFQVNAPAEQAPPAPVTSTGTTTVRPPSVQATRELLPELIPGPQINDVVAPFSLRRLDGDQSTYSEDFSNARVTLLTFANASCKYCEQHMAFLAALGEAFAAKGAQVIVVANDPKLEDAKTVLGWVTASGLQGVVLHDRKNALSRSYKIRNVPSTFLIGMKRNMLSSYGRPATVSLTSTVQLTRLYTFYRGRLPESLVPFLGEFAEPTAALFNH